MTDRIGIAKLNRALLMSGSLAALAMSQPAFAQSLVTPVSSPAPSPTSTVTSLSHDINPFGVTSSLNGDINPFNGDINPFNGDINPFNGDLNPFNGDLNPFTGDINPFNGDINPFNGDINPFNGDLNPFWGKINPINHADASAPAWMTIGGYWKGATTDWQQLSKSAGALVVGDAASTKAVADSLGAFLSKAEATWGTAYTAKTGKSFTAGFVTPLLAKYGVSATDPASLAKLTTNQRNQLFLAWYDGLMTYSGADRVDWWMSAVHWAPAITQQQGSGADTVIGLLDSNASTDADIANNIAWSGGYAATVGGHGAGVASLMVGAHDGAGVMGVAPRARVVAFNPFDATNTASWADVKTGINSLRSRGASIINASLGITGWTLPQEWQAIMASFQPLTAMPAMDPAKGLVSVVSTADTAPVYVIAAGNDGFSQTTNLNWNFTTADPGFLVVGSVDPASNISSFSNRPGTACLLKNGVCADTLANHFIVAPGELVLVSDGGTGVIRASGTSFAAPLVSGAIALLHDRWPWLAKYPQETVKIITSTAKDLGAPGVDPVYGVGMLDIEHSQSPINFNNLVFYEVKNGVATQMTVPQIQTAGVKSTWEADGVFFAMFEKIGNTYRDFQVPLSSRLTGMVQLNSNDPQHFQKFIAHRLTDWIEGKKGFSDFASFGMAAADGLHMTLAASQPKLSLVGTSATMKSALTVGTAGNRFAFTVGQGAGALVNGGVPGFARTDDYDAASGGANPLLGLASGGAFMRAQTKLGLGTVSMGYTENRLDLRDSAMSIGNDRHALADLAPYQARAVTVHANQPIGSRVELAVDYSRVREAHALLGVQGSGSSDFIGTANTDAFTLGMKFDLGSGLALAATGTRGLTHGDPSAALTTDGAIASSAYSFAIQKFGVASHGDLLVVKLSQPLRVHNGTLKLTELTVADRLTGELASTSQSFGIGGERAQVTGEIQYGASFAKGAARIGMYGKGDLQAAQGMAKAFVAGGQVSFQF